MGEEVRSNLSISDLHLVMDNYQNILKMNTILLEQQKYIIENQKDMIKKQEGLTIKQLSVCTNIDKVITRLDDCAKNLLKTNETISSSCSSLDFSLTSKLDKTEDKIVDLKLENTKQHGSLTNKLYMALGGTAGVIISLVGLLVIVYDKYTIIQKINEKVSALLIYFNI